MDVFNRADCRLTDYETPERGSLLIATIARHHLVRGMKAYHEDEDGNKFEHFVTLGPFVEGGEQVPTTYDPEVLRGLPVLDVTEVSCLSPSLSPDHIFVDLPTGNDVPGVVFWTREFVYMGVYWATRDRIRDRAFMNLSNGQLIFQVVHDQVVATQRWEILQKDKNGEWLPT